MGIILIIPARYCKELHGQKEQLIEEEIYNDVRRKRVKDKGL